MSKVTKSEVKEAKVDYQRDGMVTHTFTVRSSDICAKCGTKLEVRGVAEEKDRFYKVLAFCPACQDIYAFGRVNRRRVR